MLIKQSTYIYSNFLDAYLFCALSSKNAPTRRTHWHLNLSLENTKATLYEFSERRHRLQAKITNYPLLLK